MVRHYKEDVLKELEEKGFYVIEYINNFKIIARDKYGYKYKLNYFNVMDGKKPSMLMKNPFAYENFKLYLTNNYPYYELLDNEYKGCKTKMRFICHHHEDKGVQLNTPDNIMNNHHVCRYCGYGQMGENRRISEEIIKERCKELSLEYVSRETRNGESYILFICPKHRERGIQGMVWTHFKDCANGCVYCSSSKGEITVRKVLTNFGLSFEEQKKFDDCIHERKLRFDFYIPELNTAIEYDGEAHYMPIDFSGHGMDYARKALDLTMERDKIKNEYCKDNNIELIRIPYTEYNNIQNILYEKLMN